jgi:hypothetical protein
MNAIELGRMSRRLDPRHRRRPLNGSITNSGMNGRSLVSSFELEILAEQRVVLVYLPIRQIIAALVPGGSQWPATKRLLRATC